MYFGFDNISIQYRQNVILEKITASFPKGKTTTIIGPNGSGKSSLLRTVSRAVKPSCGQVILQERPLSRYRPAELARIIAQLPQFHSAPEDIDVRTLVSHGRFPFKRFGRGLTGEDWRIVDESLHLVGLETLAHRSVRTLSGGERQRAWIGVTLCQKPQILILDEPITHLDIGYQIEIMELIKSLGRELKITIIMVLHDINLAARYSDKILSLKDRGIAAYGDPQTIVSSENMETIFRIGSQILQDRRHQCPFMIPEKSQIHGELELPAR